VLKEKNIGFFGKGFFLKERFVLKEKLMCMLPGIKTENHFIMFYLCKKYVTFQ